jgi:hypothetical protein
MKMLVKELIKELLECNPDSQVKFRAYGTDDVVVSGIARVDKLAGVSVVVLDAE